MKMDGPTLQSWFPDFEVPLLNERVMRLKELGAALDANFEGLASNMVAASNNSASRLVQLLLCYIPGFRDTAIYKGSYIHLYKRVQILVGDVWAAYGKYKPAENGDTNIYYFKDLSKCTMFADYRIPQLLRHMGVLVYTPALCDAIDKYEEIPYSSEEEVEIRACTVIAVERLKAAINRIITEKKMNTDYLMSIELDWLLWNKGEKMKEAIPPHHRTRTIFY